jgi:hypothetical protein
MFKEGCESLQDDEQKCRPSTYRAQESMEVVEKCLKEDRTSSVRMLEEMAGSTERKYYVREILFEYLEKESLVCFSFVNGGSTSTHIIV